MLTNVIADYLTFTDIKVHTNPFLLKLHNETRKISSAKHYKIRSFQVDLIKFPFPAQTYSSQFQCNSHKCASSFQIDL